MVLILGIPSSKKMSKQVLLSICLLLFAGSPECHFSVWAILVFLGFALTISLIFNIFHYVGKQRQGKTLRNSHMIPGLEIESLENLWSKITL